MALNRDQILKYVPTCTPVNGLYDCVAPIDAQGGGGHFSAVFRGTEIAKKASVALKFFIDHGDPYRRACFDREAALAGALFKDEPLFVQTMRGHEILGLTLPLPGVGDIQLDLPYIAFEWMPNGNVERFCNPATAHHEFSRRLRIFRRMCRCVSRLHHLGCSHRDLKPGNFLIGHGDAVKLGDFGTAKLLIPSAPSLMPQYNGAVGDLRYAAPESLAGLNVDTVLAQRADIYALGAILFEMLTGEPLYQFTLKSVAKLHHFSNALRAISDSTKREPVFLGFIQSMPWTTPKVRSVNADVPRCVHSQLDDLIRELTQVDYRDRVLGLQHVHRVTRICELLLGHDERRRAKRVRRDLSQEVGGNV